MTAAVCALDHCGNDRGTVENFAVRCILGKAERSKKQCANQREHCCTASVQAAYQFIHNGAPSIRTIVKFPVVCRKAAVVVSRGDRQCMAGGIVLV